MGDAERSRASKQREFNELKFIGEMAARELKEKQEDFETKLTTVEKEREASHRDVQKLQELVETKDVALDEANNTIEMLEKKVAEIEQDIGNSAAQIFRLRRIERLITELDSRAAIDRKALESLQSNLLAEKLIVQQIHATLKKLGLDAESFLTLSLDKILDKIAEVP